MKGEPLPHEPVSFARFFGGRAGPGLGTWFDWAKEDGWNVLAEDLLEPCILATHVRLRNGQLIIVRPKRKAEGSL